MGARTCRSCEARAASALNHPGICTVHAIEQSDGQSFIVMELVEAPTLADLVRRQGPMPAAHVAAITCSRPGADPPTRGEVDAARAAQPPTATTAWLGSSRGISPP